MNFQQVLGIFKKKSLAPAVDATGRPLLQRNPGRAYVSGGSLPPQRPINTSATVPLIQQGVGQLPMSGSQQQVMQVISRPIRVTSPQLELRTLLLLRVMQTTLILFQDYCILAGPHLMAQTQKLFQVAGRE